MKELLFPRIAGIFLLVAVAATALLWAGGRFGVPKSRLEQDLRSSQHIPDNWTVVGDVTADAAVFLFYPPEQNTYGVTVYRNEPGLSFGYFFRGSHTVAGVQGTTDELPAEVEKIPLPGTGLTAYVSMNTAGVERLEQNDGNTVESHPLDDHAPFVLLLHNAGEVTFYDGDGTIVETRTRSQ